MWWCVRGRCVVLPKQCKVYDLVCHAQLRFMSFSAGSEERRSLVPVIGTLLNFTPAEVRVSCHAVPCMIGTIPSHP